MEVETLACTQCGDPFQRSTGRGRKSPLCQRCRKEHNQAIAFVRQFRVMATTIEELAEMVGPSVSRAREEVRRQQDGRCKRCERRSRLYLTQPDGTDPIGLCMKCFGKRGEKDGETQERG